MKVNQLSYLLSGFLEICSDGLGSKPLPYAPLGNLPGNSLLLCLQVLGLPEKTAWEFVPWSVRCEQGGLGNRVTAVTLSPHLADLPI